MSDYINREMAADCIVLECDDVTLEQARQAIKDCPYADVIYDEHNRWQCDMFGQSVNADDYCSYGERRDDRSV